MEFSLEDPISLDVHCNEAESLASIKTEKWVCGGFYDCRESELNVELRPYGASELGSQYQENMSCS